MARFVPDPQVLRLGEALAALRRECGLSQAEAGAGLGMTSQGWGLYEAGRRPGLFRPDVQKRLTAALGATPEALAAALSRDKPEPQRDGFLPGVSSRGRDFEGRPAQPNRLIVADDALFPWAARGVCVEFEPGLAPRPGQGCVVEMLDGARSIRVFEKADADHLHLRGAGSLDRVERIERRKVARLSAVVARREP